MPKILRRNSTSGLILFPPRLVHEERGLRHSIVHPPSPNEIMGTKTQHHHEDTGDAESHADGIEIKEKAGLSRKQVLESEKEECETQANRTARHQLPPSFQPTESHIQKDLRRKVPQKYCNA